MNKRVHTCPVEVMEKVRAAVEHPGFYAAFGIGWDVDVDTRDPFLIFDFLCGFWVLEINGGEYRQPIFYCPQCGEKLE